MNFFLKFIYLYVRDVIYGEIYDDDLKQIFTNTK